MKMTSLAVVVIAAAALNASAQPAVSVPTVRLTLKDAERAHIRKTLGEVDGVIAAAAHRLGLPRSTLFYKMRRLGISASREQRVPRNGALVCGTAQ